MNSEPKEEKPKSNVKVEFQEPKKDPWVYTYVPPEPGELEALSPASREKREKSEAFKKRVADFSAMMAEKKALQEMKERQSRRNLKVYQYVPPNPKELSLLSPEELVKRMK